jgi:phosphate transport system substrate-binding protein
MISAILPKTKNQDCRTEIDLNSQKIATDENQDDKEIRVFPIQNLKWCKMIRILLVDDQSIVRQIFQTLLQQKPGIQVIGTAENGIEAIAQVEVLQPDLVLMDVEMPTMDGITATQKICYQFPSTKVLILSSHEKEEYVSRAIEAGAKGYVLKDAATEDLETAIWSIFRGYSQLESKLLEKVVTKTAPPNKEIELIKPTEIEPKSSALSLKSAFWLLPLAVGLGVVGLFGLNLTRSSPLNPMLSATKSSACLAPELVEKKQAQYEHICQAMQDVIDVPDGQFFYGGTMGAAALRSSDVLNEIKVAHPEFHLRYLDPLVAPPDSAMGIKMLIKGELSFAESQRPLSDAEFKRARMRGFSLKQIPVAMTGSAFFTHPALQIEGLSLDQIQDIYTGKITNWKQVGGPDMPIVAVSQDYDRTGSTMSLVLQRLPIERQLLGKKVKIVRDTTATIRTVSQTPGAIGYGTQALVVNQKTVRLMGLAKWRSQNYVRPATTDGRPNKKVLRDGTYPLMQRIFVIIRQDETLDELAGIAYANLLLSQKGQHLIDRAGYQPIRNQTNE